MKIQLSSVLVSDQEKALQFYTHILGFVKHMDLPMGEARWLTVVSPEGPQDIQLVLEPNFNPAGATYQKALFDQGIPATAFAVSDIEAEHQRLVQQGVTFKLPPTHTGGPVIAVLDDTCGNYIQIYQV
ncbi:VOC family protein [Deinococcus roseus]|uniref:VOC domain-containing protein n=1 Tax=Deinococcus roseus TaxID=392414 RepID=A0ABQ2CXC2_9DEIO|nr:VOC family protein [Deinococcus roseus]GGJ26279.1 hypothetical protein GCM10008938_10550 [Deinococcus roseus]